MVAIEAELPFDNLQFFTHEEHADDISLIVHKYLGWNQRSLPDFFNLLLPDDVRSQCDTYIQSGLVPPGGSFSDPHRATCFRIAHLYELKNAFDKVDAKTFADDYVAKTVGHRE